jgi:O-acetyl-ADP-ribose deacetylase (regulator of RNase III)
MMVIYLILLFTSCLLIWGYYLWQLHKFKQRIQLAPSLYLAHGDLTAISADVVVNAAKPSLKRGGGVCGAIYGVAGERKLWRACKDLAPVRTGEAVATHGAWLPRAQCIVHAVGPVYQQHSREEAKRLLRLAYLNALELTTSCSVCSVRVLLPLISSGHYGFPVEEAFSIAVSAIGEFIKTRDEHSCSYDITIVEYGKRKYEKLIECVATTKIL